MGSGSRSPCRQRACRFQGGRWHVSIEATGGQVHAQPGDWIIKDTVGDFCVCKPGAFAAACQPM
jgi:hypothetical protein